MSNPTPIWVRAAEDGSYVAGIADQVMFMGFKTEEDAWAWLRQHLNDKYEAVLRSEERREMMKAESDRRREAELSAMLYNLPTGKKGLH